MHYRLIGIDLDGTLLNGGSAISAANRDAIRRAADAGAMIVPCTGRGWREALPVIRGIEALHWGVYVTGAMVAEIDSGESIDFAVFESHLADAVVRFLAAEPEAVLVYREHNEAGHEYLVTGEGELTDNTRWWFEITGAMVHFQREPTHFDLRNAMRIGVVSSGRRVPELRESVRDAFGDRVLVQSFAAINREDEDESVHVLEVFPAGVNKWRGLGWIALQHGIEPHEVAAIGDEINDVAMLQQAGCGIAMGNAVDAARAAAQYVTERNDADGVAYAIDRLLAGEW
jgi:HAD superfamily hydrolase (TIGR01484 family)